MSEWEAHIQSDYMVGGLSLIFLLDAGDGRTISNGSTNWFVQHGDSTARPDIEPLRLRDEQGRALLAALLRFYNGADDARMLRKDYDAERARVDKLIGAWIDAR